MRARVVSASMLALLPVITLPAGGCFETQPRSELHVIPIDTAVLGAWEAPLGAELNLTIAQFSDTEYVVQLGTTIWRAYLIEVQGRRLVQFRLLADSAPVPDLSLAEKPFSVGSYTLVNDELSVRFESSEFPNATLGPWRRRTSAGGARPTPSGQPSERAQGVTGEGELRIGAAWIGDGYSVKPSAGARLAVYPWKGAASRRLGVHFGGDWSPLSKVEGTLPDLAGRTQTSTSWFTVGWWLGADVVRTPRFVFDARAGGAFDVVVTRFALDESGSSGSDSDGFVDVCNLVAFRERCSDRTRFTATLALGARVWPRRGAPWFLGVDYTWNRIGRSQVVATIGGGPAR